MIVMKCNGRRTRILYLLDQLYSARGGAEQHLHWLLSRLPEDQFEKHFAILSTVHNCDMSTWPVTATVISEKCGLGPRNWWCRLRAVTKMIREQRIDIIHTFCPMSECVALLSKMIGCRAKVVGSRRNTGYCLARFGSIRSRTLQVFKAAYVANSEAARAHAVAREKISPKRITVIPNPVCEQRIVDGMRNLRPRSELADENTLIVAMVATVRPVKDYLTFVHAARIVADRYPSVRFVSIGEQEHGQEELIDLTNSLNLGNQFLWLGGTDNPYSLLPHVDVAVLSSHSESFSNAVLEYSAAGLPSVVADVGALSEIVLDGETGFVVPPACPEALAGRILELLRDRTLRKRLGAAGRNHVLEHFSESTVLDAYIMFYERLETGVP